MLHATPAPAISTYAGAFKSRPDAGNPWRNFVIVAGGPSLTAEHCALVAAARERDVCRVVAINSTWRRVPFADALYAGDHKWWAEYLPDVRGQFAGELLTSDRRSRDAFGIGYVHREHEPGLSPSPDYIHAGGDSAYQAIGVAAQRGARRIALVAVDMMRGPQGEEHHHPDHPAEWGAQQDPAVFLPHYPPLAADLSRVGVWVTNCSPRTALTVFLCADLAATLDSLE